jgi:hypothetical protein
VRGWRGLKLQCPTEFSDLRRESMVMRHARLEAIESLAEAMKFAIDVAHP